jgi:hypothetical protein
MAALSGSLPGGLSIMHHVLATPALRRLPFVFGRMSKRGVPEELMRSWLKPLSRPDLRKYVSVARSGRRYMLGATPALARALREFIGGE